MWLTGLLFTGPETIMKNHEINKILHLDKVIYIQYFAHRYSE